jgi:5'/3'-nucleotidase SurE
LRQDSWNCFVCLPARPESFVAKSVGKGPLSVERLGERTWHVHGPPASAVNIALYHLAPSCDFVISGPNVGHNAGRCVTRTRMLFRLSKSSKLSCAV